MGTPTAGVHSPESTPGGTPLVARRNAITPNRAADSVDGSEPAGEAMVEDTGADTQTGESPEIPSPRTQGVARMTRTSPTPATRRRSSGRVLIARKSPALSVQTLGPERITVGKESAYEVVVENSGQVAADDVSVRIGLPPWADVLAAEASTGATQSMHTQQEGNQFQWKVGRLEARSQQRLTLRIVPRQRRPIDLAVSWNYNPVVSQTVIEVEEPSLEISLHGPRELLFGKKDIYRLELENTGNGAAEDVLITLQPIGSSGAQPVRHRLGTIAAGEKSVIELEITARQAGQLTVQVKAEGGNGVQAELSESILVRRGHLQLEVDGPAVQYVGTEASYTVHATNDGNAAAENVEIVAELPEGARYLAHDNNGILSENKDAVTWQVSSFAPGEQLDLTVKCRLGKAGESRLQVSGAADTGLEASASAATKVEAIADLVLDVEDPAGPVAVGDEATYQLTIQNRGTKHADAVDVVVFFSHGIEPVGAEGATYKLAPGQVVFDPIPSVPAGEEVTLTIKARGEKPGNHIFRAEVHCKPLGTRLLSEETTRFYQGGPISRREKRGQPEVASRRATGQPTPAPKVAR